MRVQAGKKWKALKGGLLIAAGVLFVSITVFPFHTANALSGNQFRAGRIIDDIIYTNANAMSVYDIQAFLDSKVPNCDTQGTQQSTHYNSSAGRYYTRAEWGALNGNHAPYTCLRNYFENTSNMINNYGGASVQNGTSAAGIINNAAKRYNINPQVLLVTLQKEQGLITDDWPWNNQYQKAMGYACPDTASCNPNYAGLYRQVDGAAWQMRRYLDNPNNYNYKQGNNNIRFNPNTGCGSTIVNIQSGGTAALYNYTPYQPNQAALNNLYGTGDGCSAYGNRNFWRYFNDWFGSSTTDNYTAQFYSIFPARPSLKASQESTVTMKYKNMGLFNWYDDTNAAGAGVKPTHLAATGPINRSSIFAMEWGDPGRPGKTFTAVYEADGVTLAANQHLVQPGQVASYDIPITVPIGTNPGNYREWFQVIQEGASTWWMGGESYIDVYVEPTKFEGKLYSNYSQLGLKTSQSFNNSAYIRNTGNIEWYDQVPAGAPAVKVTRLAATNPINRDSLFGSTTWLNAGRPTSGFTAVYESDGVTLATNQHMVSPGQIAKFNYRYTVPIGTNPGTYREWFQPIMEGAPQWWMGGEFFTDVTVQNTDFNSQVHSKSNTLTIARGNSATAFIQYKNTGNIEWYDEVTPGTTIKPTRLAASDPINRESQFSNGSWVNKGRPTTGFNKVYESDGVTLATNQHMVSPGQIVRFEFPIAVAGNATVGTYHEGFQPILEGAPAWWMGGQTDLTITVQ